VQDQNHAYCIILLSADKQENELIFLDAWDGTGKTFLLNLLLAKAGLIGKFSNCCGFLRNCSDTAKWHMTSPCT
jgi:hypothetical protein